MTHDLASSLYHCAGELSKDVGPGLAARAEAELDRHLEGEDIRTVAIRYLVERAREIARYRAASVEREATKARLAAELPDLQEHQIDRWEFMSERDRQAAIESARHWQKVREEREARTAGHIGRAKPGSQSKENDCQECDECKESWQRYYELEREHLARRAKIYDEYEAELRAQLFVEWTEELLDAEIAMPDGTRTTWGQATVEQHRRRHEMLAKNAMANAENAARHSLAIEQLEASGAPNLAALAGVMASAE